MTCARHRTRGAEPRSIPSAPAEQIGASGAPGARALGTGVGPVAW